MLKYFLHFLMSKIFPSLLSLMRDYRFKMGIFFLYLTYGSLGFLLYSSPLNCTLVTKREIKAGPNVLLIGKCVSDLNMDVRLILLMLGEGGPATFVSLIMNIISLIFIIV